MTQLNSLQEAALSKVLPTVEFVSPDIVAFEGLETGFLLGLQFDLLGRGRKEAGGGEVECRNIETFLSDL